MLSIVSKDRLLLAKWTFQVGTGLAGSMFKIPGLDRKTWLNDQHWPSSKVLVASLPAIEPASIIPEWDWYTCP